MPWPVHAVLALLFAAVAISAGHAYLNLLLPLQTRLAAPAAPDQSAPAGSAFTPEVRRWWPAIERWASEFQLQPALVATVMQIESCGHPGATSSAGAIGLFQVMPFHFDETEDPYRPDTNALRGLAYLSSGLQLAGGDTRLALAGYNGGHSLITRPPSSWPDETRRYVNWGANLLADIEAGRTPSPTLSAWLAAGGSGLCQQAATARIAAVAQMPTTAP